MSLLPCVKLDPSSPPEATIIWLHGLGADGHDFEGIVPELGLPDALGVRFLFPHAPHQPVTINGGYVMRAWYDIANPDLIRAEDEKGIRASGQSVCQLIEDEIAQGIPAERIVLAGFSQGGAIALHTGLRYPRPLAGILVLSAYLPLANMLQQEAHAANAQIPIMMAHGTEDNIVPLPKAQISCQQLKKLGYPVEWYSYPMPHSMCPREIADIGSWLLKVLPLRGKEQHR